MVGLLITQLALQFILAYQEEKYEHLLPLQHNPLPTSENAAPLFNGECIDCDTTGLNPREAFAKAMLKVLTKP